jgi:YVTN family beta-propeller protein
MYENEGADYSRGPDKRLTSTAQRRRFGKMLGIVVPVLMMGALFSSDAAKAKPSKATVKLSTPSQSTTIALTSDDRRLIVVNREANSVTILSVRDRRGQDAYLKLAEIAVDREPRCVAISPDDREAYVTNGISGTVSVVDLRRFRVMATIPVGTEPRGCALTPSGGLLT